MIEPGLIKFFNTFCEIKYKRLNKVMSVIIFATALVTFVAHET